MAIINVDEKSSTEIVVKDRSLAVVKRGNVIAKGESTIVLLNRSKATITHNVCAYTFDEAEITALQRSTVYAYGETKLTVRNKGRAYVGDYVGGKCENDAVIYDLGTTDNLYAVCGEQEGAEIAKGTFRLKRKYEKARRQAYRLADGLTHE